MWQQISTVLELRELVAILWVCLSISLALIFAWYLFEERKTPGWYSERANKAAIGLMFYFIGASLARMWSLAFLLKYPGGAVDQDYNWALLAIAGGFGVTGALCAIRVFSPRWGKTVMIICGTLSAAVTFALWAGLNTGWMGLD